MLSLNRLKNKNFSEGASFQIAGYLLQYSSEYLTLQGQEEKKSFFVDLNSYLELDGRKIPFLKWSKYLYKNQCILLKIKVTQGVQKILSIQILVDSRKKPVPCPFHYFKLWHSFVREVENFFLLEGLCPVQTPSLVSCPGTEAHLRFFSTQRRQNSIQEKLWLASSPEIHLKKLLCRGATDIFEIHKCYRNEEQGTLNWNEFYMLEWYRAYASLDVLIQDLENLLSYLKKQGLIEFELKKIHQISVQRLFEKYCGIHLNPESRAEDLIPVLNKWSIPFSKSFSFEDLFHLIFLNVIEPKLDPSTPTIIYHYPPSLRAYSQLTKDNWADRFELYWKGMELANAFNEVNDPKVQKEIFEQDIKNHAEQGLKMDEEFITEMESGFPPTSGIALGLERLFMAIHGLKTFPIYF